MNRLLVALLAIIGLLTCALILYVAYWLVFFKSLLEIFVFAFQGPQ